jgi:hypothetical protein
MPPNDRGLQLARALRIFDGVFIESTHLAEFNAFAQWTGGSPPHCGIASRLLLFDAGQAKTQ